MFEHSTVTEYSSMRKAAYAHHATVLDCDFQYQVHCQF